MNSEYTPQIIVSLLALGMALSFVVADRASPISRTLSAFLACIGISIAVNVLIGAPLRAQRGILAWDGLFALPEVLAFVLGYEWLLRVRRTIPAGNLRTSELLGSDTKSLQLTPGEALSLKGFASPVQSYVLAAA